MKLPVLTICLILIGINLLAWGLSGGQVTIDLRTGLAALCLNSYFFLFLLLGYAPLQKALGDWYGTNVGRTLAAVPVLWIPYTIYSWATDNLRVVPRLTLALYLLVPILIVLLTRRLSNRLRWQEWLVALVLWLPLDFGLMKGVWTWPEGGLAYGMSALVGTCLGVFCVVCLQGLDGVGYRWRWRAVDWRVAAGYFALYAPVAIGLGLLTGFLQPAEKLASPGALLPMALGIFIFIGIPEELLFRGIIQNLLEKAHWPPRPGPGGGLAHLRRRPSQQRSQPRLALLPAGHPGRTGLRPGLRQNPQPDGPGPAPHPGRRRLARVFPVMGGGSSRFETATDQSIRMIASRLSSSPPACRSAIRPPLTSLIRSYGPDSTTLSWVLNGFHVL